MRYLAAIAAALAAIFFAYQLGEHSGKALVQQAWDKQKAAQLSAENLAILSRMNNNERMREQQALNEKRMRNDYENEISRVRAAANSPYRLRIKADRLCSGFAATTTTQATAGSDAAATGTLALPEPVAGDLWRLVQEADDVLAQCRLAQRFIQSLDQN